MIIEENKMKAYAPCYLELYDKYFTLTYDDGYVAKFPRTSSMVFNKSTEKFNQGDLICQLTKLYTFSYTLDCVIKLCKALGRVTLEDIKNDIKFQRCISTSDCEVHYDFDEGVIIVGNSKVPLTQDTMYFYPEGEKISFGTKFCSGIENVQALMPNLTYLETYYVFRSQFRHLMSSISEEIIEALFYLITDKNNNVYKGVLQSNTNNDSFVPRMAYGYAKGGLIQAMKGLTKIKNDTYTNAITNPFLMNDMMNAIEKNEKRGY